MNTSFAQSPKFTWKLFLFEKIHDGTSTNSPKITEICSSKHPPTIISEGNSLTISLAIENDFSFTFNLKAYYTVIDNGILIGLSIWKIFILMKFLVSAECGGEFNSISGQIGKFLTNIKNMLRFSHLNDNNQMSVYLLNFSITLISKNVSILSKSH